MTSKQLDKKEFTKCLISTLIIESQHLDPERIFDTVDTLVSNHGLIVKRKKKTNV